MDSFAAVTQADIDSARGAAPEIAGALAAMTGTDADGTQVAIATIHLRDTADDESVQDAERRINQLAAGAEGPLRVSSVSPVVVEDEYRKATEEGMAPLIGLALLLIAALILVFLRTLSDLLLTLLAAPLPDLDRRGGGLARAERAGADRPAEFAHRAGADHRDQPHGGLCHPGRLALPRAASCRRSGGDRGADGTATRHHPADAGRRHDDREPVGEPVLPISVIGDFGIVAGLGVGLSLIVMLTLLPAGRMIIDRRRESRGTLTQPRPVSNALPGIGRVAEVLGRSVTRRPAPYFVVVIAVTTVLGFAATGLESGFSIRDILPSNGTVLKDLDTLDAAVGGSTEIASVLVKAEASETRTLLNLHDLTTAFEDEQRRPQAAAGPIQVSYGLLVRDWTEDSGEPGDKYDPEARSALPRGIRGLELDPELMQEFLDKLEARDPAVAHSLVNDPAG